MTIQAQCPICEKALSLAESEAGGMVRCPNCAEEFVASAARPVSDSPRESLAEDTGTAEMLEPISAMPSAPAQVGPPGFAYRSSDQPRLGKIGASKAGAWFLLAVSVLVAIVVLLGLAVAMQRGVPGVPAVQRLPDPDGGLPPEIAEAVALARDLNDGKVPEELERIIARNRGKDGVAFPPPPPDPTAEPPDLDHALRLTRDPLWLRRKSAAAWLAREPVNATRRAEVNQALLAMLRDPQTLQHQAAADALFVWADDTTRTELVELAQQERFAGARAALMLLARMKDERAAPIAALELSHFLKRAHARRVLQVLGPMAEKDVAVYLDSEDRATRMEACRVLERIGTAASVPALEAAVQKERQLGVVGNAAIEAIRMRRQ